MQATNDMSLLSLISHASVPVQLIMLMLLGISIMSWTYIFAKRLAIKRAHAQTRRFEDDFWSGGDLSMLQQAVASRRDEQGALARIFDAGMTEFLKARRGNASNDATAVLDGPRRAMRAAYQREMDALESHLNFLASAGSVSPYIGLLGTVWGIMHAFQNIAISKNTSLAVVAPSIAEALFATAVGLIAAIPAYIAYNKFSTDAGKYAGRLEGFADDLSTAIQRRLTERV